MADQPITPAPSDRGTQRAIGLLITVAILLIAYRWGDDHFQLRPTEFKRETVPVHRVELNSATRSELLQLPGVGPGRADKILAVRNSRGGFQHIDDLRAVDGIGDITLARLRPHLSVEANEEPSDEPVRLSRKSAEVSKTTAVKKPTPDGPIDLNRASLADLKGLPGIGPTLAQRIIDERERKPFTKLEDLRRVGGIGAKRLEQLKAYVAVMD